MIVLDIVMADLGGLDMLKELRADPDLASVPVIMLTVESRISFIQEAMNYKVKGYLIKPVKSRELKDRISKELGI